MKRTRRRKDKKRRICLGSGGRPEGIPYIVGEDQH